MTLIEGVGDEVTDFFIVAAVILIGYIAWCSTNISEQPLIRTVLILQHRTRTRIAELRANTSRIDTRNSSAEESSEETIVQSDSPDSSNEAEQNCPIHNGPATPEATGSLATGTSEQVLIEAMDSLNEDTNLLHRPVKLPSSDTTKSEETDQSAPSEPTDSAQETCDEDNEITIKLKFINDDQKIVTGRLKEMLSEFKRRPKASPPSVQRPSSATRQRNSREMRTIPQLRGPLFSPPASTTDPFAFDFLPVFGQQQPRVPERAQRRQRDQFPAPGVGPQSTASQYFDHAASLCVVLQVSLHSAVHSVDHFSALRPHCAVHSRSLRQFLSGPRKLKGSR
ncbi:Protein of unknown function, partial [Cotesia congregata]